MTLTVAGRTIPKSQVRVWTWPQHAWARIDLAEDAEAGSPGTPAVLTLGGVQILAGTLGPSLQVYRHVQVDIRPLVDRHFATGGGHADPVEMNEAQLSAIAEYILQGTAQVQVQDAAKVELPRWSTIERPASWAWESMMRTAAGTLGVELSWRYDPRDDVIRIEADRSDWPAPTLPTALRSEGDSTLYPAVSLQAGDRLPTGAEVTHTETVVNTSKLRTTARHPA